MSAFLSMRHVFKNSLFAYIASFYHALNSLSSGVLHPNYLPNLEGHYVSTFHELQVSHLHIKESISWRCVLELPWSMKSMLLSLKTSFQASSNSPMYDVKISWACRGVHTSVLQGYQQNDPSQNLEHSLLLQSVAIDTGHGSLDHESGYQSASLSSFRQNL